MTPYESGVQDGLLTWSEAVARYDDMGERYGWAEADRRDKRDASVLGLVFGVLSERTADPDYKTGLVEGVRQGWTATGREGGRG